ncbi:MAG: anthranilate synthase component I [Alphaproteobacteria bacterium]
MSNDRTNHTTLGYRTRGGISVERHFSELDYAGAIEPLMDMLDERRGVLLSSGFDYPGRYTRWDMGFVDPPLAIVSRERAVRIEALNPRGQVLLAPLADALTSLPVAENVAVAADLITCSIVPSTERFPEELRSRQPSVFSVLRPIIGLLGAEEDGHLGLYGAFGYDLALQFEPLKLRLVRPPDQRDMVLYLPDDVVIVDHQSRSAARYRYEFRTADGDTRGLERGGAATAYRPAVAVSESCDHAPGEYAACVRLAREAFARGDLFEVVPGQTFTEVSDAPPSEVFRRLRRRNPAPYGFLINLGDGEYLVGASPEMYVRVAGRRVETCPISGTIARGDDAIGDANQILSLLNSEKEASELTMCTDVDRNDKSRICEPGSVRVIGRRQIEIYSRLIHTVDHVEGLLREEFDALDAFLTHAWAVTVTGAPKQWAMQFIEDHERSARRWYGGAVGVIGFNGSMNTGLTLRTVRIKDGVAEVRAGATLLYDSDPDAEEAETRLKAAALLDAIRRPRTRPAGPARRRPRRAGTDRRVLLVDHQDSFVHTLANYLRQTGAHVMTLRSGFSLEAMRESDPDLVVLSPGPGRPSDFDVGATIDMVAKLDLPLFGVCLGLQGLAEHQGATLAALDYPQHGKASVVRVLGGRLFEDLPERFTVGRYHSLHALRETLPPTLAVTAETDDGVAMALEHRERPWAAVQFHPESILTLEGGVGLRLIENAMRLAG